MAVETKTSPQIADFKPGDSVRVTARIVEGDRERLQTFEGVVLRARRGGGGVAFTVRRVTHGVGVERTFLLNSPRLQRVEVRRRGKVRRAKLYYLRGLTGKAARIKEEGRVASRPQAQAPPPAEEEAE